MKKAIVSVVMSAFLMSSAVFADGQVLAMDRSNPTSMSEDYGDYQELSLGAMVGLILGLVEVGCSQAQDEGKALATRDPSIKAFYEKNKWKIRLGAAVMAPGVFIILRCFERGLLEA